jgi:hypothetical protein
MFVIRVRLYAHPVYVHVSGCNSRDQWFDTDGESDSSLQLHLSRDLKIMKRIYSLVHRVSFRVVIQDQNWYLFG